jgi:hypothetical protein
MALLGRWETAIAAAASLTPKPPSVGDETIIGGPKDQGPGAVDQNGVNNVRAIDSQEFIRLSTGMYVRFHGRAE